MQYDRHRQSVYLGDRISVPTIRGYKGDIIGRLPDGRTIVFSRDSPYVNMLSTGQSVECNVIYVSKGYIIVDPIREPDIIEKRVEPEVEIETADRSELQEDDILFKLTDVIEKGEWEMAVVAMALRYLIENFESLKLPVDLPEDIDLVVEETTLEDSVETDFLDIDNSFLLSQAEVREKELPKSDFLRYLDEGQEEEVEEEKVEVDEYLSIRSEEFGSVKDLPSDVRLLTVGQTRYLKTQHLKDLDGYDSIDRFSMFFSDLSALQKGEYGNVFYASSGTNPWNKTYKIIVERRYR